MILESPDCYEIVVPPQERVNYILKEYKHLQEEPNRSALKSKLDILRVFLIICDQC
jgi:hypothetical protein